MFLVDEATAATSRPAMVVKGSAGYFTKGDPTTATPATIVPDDWLNMIQDELKAVLGAASITPDQTKTHLDQLATAIATLITNASNLALKKASNLSDVANAGTARTNLGLGSAATQSSSAFDVAGAAAGVLVTSLQKASNLSDVANAGTARTNLGLGSAATQSSSAFDAAGAAAGVLATSLQKASNLSDLVNIGAALGNLGFVGGPGSASVNVPNVGAAPLIIKWGQGASTGGGAIDTFNFAVAFPNASLVVLATYIASAVPSSGAVGGLNFSASQYKIQDTSAGSHGFFFIAIGF
jgi:hypothetical protein